MSQGQDLLRERLREAAQILHGVRVERDELLLDRDEPIAIVGMGCRFPGGADTPEAYWKLLADGRDAVTPLAPRWKLVGSTPDENVPRWAGLLEEAVDEFDPAFFGISPREARSMDPQHRLLIEVAWEALEDAGVPPLSLEQSRTGVFVGAFSTDYVDVIAQQPPAEHDAYSSIGNLLSVAAGRLAYTLGLQGPCMTVDTACSSSLVTVHLACRSLRAKESDLVLAGGVNLILSADKMTAVARTQVLSPDGRCKAFDTSANGFVRGEGCGLVVLKRLSDARRDGDRIWALIRGSAVNQDGRSAGLTAPSARAQEALLRDALKSARIGPASIGYVETHGTGTALGDAIELAALSAVVGRKRDDGSRCMLGAVKTNIGHLEGAAGVAGLIKAALVLWHEQIPQNLNLRRVNAHIELEETALALATRQESWPRGEKPRFAGVSSFGIGGTNAHVVLEEAPVPSQGGTPAVTAEPIPILLSAKTKAALCARAAQLRAHLDSHPEQELIAIAATLAHRRSHLEHRAVILAKSREELREALAALSQGESSALVQRDDEPELGAALALPRLPPVSLPPYPFERQRYWVAVAESPQPVALLRSVGTSGPPPGEVDAVALAARWSALPADRQRSEMLELIRREAGAVLGMTDGSGLRPQQPLKELGLDSLMAGELRNRIEVRAGVRLDLSAIWRLATLQDLAEELAARLAARSASTLDPAGLQTTAALPAVQSRPIVAPLSAGQKRLYFLDRALELRPTYNLTLAVRLAGRIDPELLRSALESLIARHEQLRTSFIETDGRPQQRILPWVEPPVEELVLRAEAPEDRDVALRQLFETEARKPFDLSKAPLFRLLYVRLGDSEAALALIWHHITTDGVSMAAFLSELAAAYQAQQIGKALELPPAPSYLLYTARQSAWLETAACNAQRAFWRDKLDGLPALDLPTDRPTPRIRSERGGAIPFSISAETSSALEALARDAGTTPFVVLTAAWSALLSRYSGQEDFAIGTALTGRSDAAFQRAIGFLVNTLPIRCPLNDEPTGLEYIQRLHREIWSALDNQDLPLDEIVRMLAPSRQAGLTGSPLFQTCLVYESSRWSADSFAGIPVIPVIDSVVEKVGGTSKFDLTLSLIRRPQGFAGSIEYSADLFDAATIQRCTGHFTTLLTHLVREPQRRLWELPLLTEAERRQIAVEWNDTDAEFPGDRCIHQLFEAQVARTPDTPAVIFQHEQLTYRELNARANQLAHRLRILGVGPNVLVALCMDRSLGMVVGILGILKAGGAYVPIDPEYPRDRIEFMLEDTRPAALLTSRVHLPELPRSAVPVLCLDEPSELETQPITNPSGSAAPSDLAYVIYTSGSTGRPKGVAVMHRSVCNLLPALNSRAWGQTPLRAAMLAPVVFDMSIKPLFGALLYGHTLYLVDRETRRDGTALLAFFERHRIEWSDCTPTILTMLVEAGLPTYRPLALKVLLCGGEALPTALLTSLYAPRVHPELQVINVYGPTEACVNVNANAITASTLDAARPTVPLGRPFENTQLYVLDSHLQPVPVGIPGELHIGGVGLARGYLNQPSLTAQKFIPNPFRAEPGSRLYRTGDLVRYLPDGKIDFLGRIDHQVKLRGYRIELGEIESVLASHADVGSCVVVAREDRPGSNQLVAYVVPQAGRGLDPEGLRAHLARVLPDYMLPAAYVSLTALPLTRNGKVDRKALPAPVGERSAESFDPPSGPLECALADLFSSTLKVPRIGRHDDFFALGGDSVSAMQAIARAQQAGFALTVKQLFASPTLAKLVAAMTGSARPSCLMTLAEGQAPGGVVLVPPSGGVFYRAHDLARRLAVKTPVFALLSPLVIGASERPDSVEALAALYARELLDRIPAGPLALVGYSFGGPVALELSRQLSTRGRSAELLILLDSRPRAKGTTAELDPQSALDAVLDTMGLPPVRLLSESLPDALREVAAHFCSDAVAAAGMRSFLGSIFESALLSNELLRTWEPRAPQAPVHLLRIEGDVASGSDYGWSDHFALASVRTLPGRHHALLRPPYLETTMNAIQSLLDDSGSWKR